MSTGDDGGPPTGPTERPERRRTPPPVSRTPPPRTSSGDCSEVEHRSVKPARQRGSIFGRVLGRQGLEDALNERLQPHDYESTRPILKWLILGLFIFAVAGAYAVFTDVEFRNQLADWQSEGLTEIPVEPRDVAHGTLIANLELQNPDELLCNEAELSTGSVVAQGCRNIDKMIAYAASQKLDCSTLEDLSSVISDTRAAKPDCQRLVDLSVRFEDLDNRRNITDIVIVLLLLAVAFPFTSLVHRASRNLKTLKSEGQKHSPDGSIIRFFVPILNIYKPLFVIIELFKASDPLVPDVDRQAWKKSGGVAPVAIIWALIWGASVIFNPITVSRIIYRNRDDLADVSSTSDGLIIADILVIVLGLSAILMVTVLSRWQEARAAKYGTVTVTPPQPRDPLEKALSESMRMRDRSSTGSKDGDSNRRQK